MRVFRYWTEIEQTVPIDGVPTVLRCFGGSNLSMEDARRDATLRLAPVLQRITGQERSRADYEADIREEVLVTINGRNVVTRNRYGAEVLNSSELMFIDIDEPRYRLRDFFSFPHSLAQRKKLMIDFVMRTATRPKYAGLGFRLYETHNGVRVLVTGQNFPPASAESQKFLRGFNTDRLYAYLCAKQGCYRARLTPKPHRMKCRTIRLAYPRLDAATDAQVAEWVAEYNRVRVQFSTCRFIRTIGREARHPVIDLHDQTTGTTRTLKLA